MHRYALAKRKCIIRGRINPAAPFIFFHCTFFFIRAKQETELVLIANCVIPSIHRARNSKSSVTKSVTVKSAWHEPHYPNPIIARNNISID